MQNRKFLQTLRSKCGPACMVIILIKILGSLLGLFILSYFPVLPVYIIDSIGLPSKLYMSDVSCSECNNFTAKILIEPKNLNCNNDDVMIVTLVMSSPEEREKRDAIRETWATTKQYRNYSLKTYFIIGIDVQDMYINNRIIASEMSTNSHISNNPVTTLHVAHSSVNIMNNSSVNQVWNNRTFATLVKLRKENNDYGDVLVFDIRDSYELSTNRTVLALTWAVDRCAKARYVMKTTSDSFNVLERFLDYVYPIPNKKFLGGLCVSGTSPDRNSSSRLRVPEHAYPGKFYPLHAKGRGYILSMFSAAQIVALSRNVRYIVDEEVFITGLCRSVLDIHCSNMLATVPKKLNQSDCHIATNVGNIAPVSNRSEMSRLWDTSRNSTLAELCRKIPDFIDYKDVYRDNSIRVVVIGVFAIVAVLMQVAVCCFAKRSSCSSSRHKAKGYKKVDDEEKFEEEL